MKKFLLLFVMLIAFICATTAQTKYETQKANLEQFGFEIGLERQGNIKEGDSFSHIVEFGPDTEYAIIACSNDPDVRDIDIFVYDSAGKLVKKDEDTDSIPIVTLTVEWETNYKIVIKNYSSRTPYYDSLCRMAIGYR